MTQATQKPANMNVEIRLQNCTLTSERIDFLKNDLGSIPQLTARSPIVDLHIDIHKHPHQKDFHIKMSLRMGSVHLFTGDRHEDLMAAYRDCVSKLSAKVKEHQSKRAAKNNRKEKEHEIDMV